MPLPKISTPTYELVLPSTGKKIKYRPFLVREEKILILALESEDSKQVTTSIKSILKSCISTRGIKIDDLPTFDIEYLFLNIRGKSVGESLDLMVTCPDDGVTQVPVKLFIDEIEIKKDPNHTKDIKIDENLTLRLKYPSLDQFIQNNFDMDTSDDAGLEQSFDVIAGSIDIVYNEEESWAAADCTKKELKQWVEQLNTNQFKKIEEFFTTMPKLSHTLTIKNPKTEVESEVTLEGLASFFG